MKHVFNKLSGAMAMSPDSEGLCAAVEAGVGSNLTQPEVLASVMILGRNSLVLYIYIKCYLGTYKYIGHTGFILYLVCGNIIYLDIGNLMVYLSKKKKKKNEKCSHIPEHTHTHTHRCIVGEGA